VAGISQNTGEARRPAYSELYDSGVFNADISSRLSFQGLLGNFIGLPSSFNGTGLGYYALVQTSERTDGNRDTNTRNNYQRGLRPKIKISLAACLFVASVWGIRWGLSRFYDGRIFIGAATAVIFGWFGVIVSTLVVVPFVIH